jgi:hypothetical protein
MKISPEDVKISPEKCKTCIYSMPPKYEKAKCGNPHPITYLKHGEGWFCQSFKIRKIAEEKNLQIKVIKNDK